MNAIFDAKADPMGLADLRVLLHDEAGRRWTRAARMIKRAIVGNDILGVGDKAPMTTMPAADRASLFGRWLDERLMADVGEGWMTPHIGAAAGRAQASIAGLGDFQSFGGFVSQTSYVEPKSKKVCCAATDAALAGIRDAVSRRASSAVATSLISSHRRASRIAAQVDQAMGEGLQSTRRLSEHALSMAYNQATLDALERKGVKLVNTRSEHTRAWPSTVERSTAQPSDPQQSDAYLSTAKHGNRAAASDEAAAQPTAAGIMFITPDGQTLFLHRVDGEGWAFPGGMVHAPETLENGAVREAQEELGGHYATGQLDFATRNDGGPIDYTTFLHSTPWTFEPTLNHEHDDYVWADWQDPPEPLHPGVRDTLDRLKGLMEDFDPSEPRDKEGRWTNVYHGTSRSFDKLKVPAEESDILDRMLGVHVAKDPEVANTFATGQEGHWGKTNEGGRIIPLKLDESKFKPVDQSSGGFDQVAVEKEVMREAYQAEPAMLERYLTEARAIPKEKAGGYARDLIANKLSPDGMADLGMRHDNLSLGGAQTQLDRFLNNYGGRPYNKADRFRAVELARKKWRSQGYQGLSYQDTSPMETGGAVKDKTAFIVFDPHDLVHRYTGARDFDPDEPRDEIGRWTAGEGPAGPYLIPTVRWKGKSYYGTSHAAAAHSNPQLTKELSEANWGDENVIRYTTPEGKQLDRYEARKYAEENGLLDPKYAHAQRELISEDLFAAAVAPSHLRFRRTSALAERGMSAVSPSQHEIDLDAATKALGGEKQKTFEQASAEIDHGLGLDAKSVAVVGAWKDGAENALITQASRASWDQLATSAAMKAHLTNQKAALVFKQQADGDAALYSFHAKGDVASIHAGLIEDGVAFHSIAPEGDGATVYVADLDGSAYDGVAKAAERFNAKVDYQIGRAAFIGSDGSEGSDVEQRAAARRAYEQVIGQSPVSGSAEVWRRVHDRWAQALADALFDAARRNPQAKHPRTGKFAKAHIAARERHRRRTGQFGTQTPAEGLQRAAERAQSAFAGAEGEWDVLTAGDDKVCKRCQAISDGGPYTIDRARSLIPAHPSCRCRFVEAGTVELDAGPEDEPRDERGRWTEGYTPDRPPDFVKSVLASHNPMNKAEWILEKAKQAVTEVGYDPERVFLSLKPKKFKLGDKEYTEAGEAFTTKGVDGGGVPRNKGDIVIYGQPDFSRDFPVRGTAVHEAMHQKWQAVGDELVREPGNDGPLVKLINPVFRDKMDALKAQDGVSEYSKSHWQAYANGKGTFETAVHETLAEIARLKDEGSDFMVKPTFKPVWRDLYNAVEKAWTDYVKPKALARA